jgi:hypothetical protein
MEFKLFMVDVVVSGSPFLYSFSIEFNSELVALLGYSVS